MSAKLINVILDLETLGTDEDAAIIQIGMCVPNFDRKYVPLGLVCELEVTIAYEDVREECRAGMFTMSNSTMHWWESQDSETRKIVFSGQDSYTTALDQVEFFLKSLQSGGAEVAVWGNGSDFDNRLLAYTMSALGYKPAWKYYNNRCLRTLKALFPSVISQGNEDSGERKHTALGDARYEARVMSTIRDGHMAARVL